MNKNIKYINSIDFTFIAPLFKKTGVLKECKRDEYLIKQGDPISHIGYIESGIFRHKVVNEGGNSHIVGYSFHNDLITDYPSFLSRANSLTSIQAVCDSKVYLITYEELKTYCESNQDAEHSCRKAIEEFFIVVYKRLLSFYCDSPEYRYKELLRRSPYLFKHVSLKEISSFIGVKPETLSRIRSKMKKNP